MVAHKAATKYCESLSTKIDVYGINTSKFLCQIQIIL